MLNKDIFKEGIQKLILEYGDRGFVMTKEKTAQWYERFKYKSDDEFDARIRYVLDNCAHAPYMADIVQCDAREYMAPE